MPVLNKAILKGWRDNHDAIGMLVEKAGNSRQSVMQQGILATDPDRRERFRPQVAHLEHERNLTRECNPPSCEANQELGRGGDDHVRAWDRHTTKSCRETEGCIIAHPFMRFTVGQGPEPGAEDSNALDLLPVSELAHSAAPLQGNDPGRMVRKSCQYGDIVPGAGPVLGQFAGARSRRTHLRRKVLGKIKDFHATVEGIAKKGVRETRIRKISPRAAG